MNCAEAIDYIHSIPKFVRPLGNKNLAALLDTLGNPQRGGKFIHIAGTNGKGSTAAMLSAILAEAGYKTGMFTSPFIEVFNERIQINNELIPDDALADVTERVKAAMEKSGFFVSEFAFITAAAFLYFKERACDVVVLETGMGGKLDATNVIDAPLVSVITAIGYDHMQFLGDTIEEIAAEKCGIIKQGCPVAAQPNTAVREIIEGYAAKRGADLVFCNAPTVTEDGIIYDGRHYALSLKGAYQPINAAGVLETVNILNRTGFTIGDNAVRRGLLSVRWPARFEWVRDNVVIDGGHNIDGIRALSASIRALNRRCVTVAAMMSDKAVGECMAEIAAFSDTLIATEIDMPRCMSAKRLSEFCGECEPDFKRAIRRALDEAGDGIVCICGSLYFAAEARRLLT